MSAAAGNGAVGLEQGAWRKNLIVSPVGIEDDGSPQPGNTRILASNWNGRGPHQLDMQQFPGSGAAHQAFDSLPKRTALRQEAVSLGAASSVLGEHPDVLRRDPGSSYRADSQQESPLRHAPPPLRPDAQQSNNVSTIKPAWTNILQVSSSPKPELFKLSYFEPTVVDGVKVALCTDEEIAENCKYWESSLVGYVMERRPYSVRLKRELLKLWKPTGRFEVYSRENGVFIFYFAREEDCARVLEEEPWYFDNRLIVLKRWEQGSVEKDLLTQIPIWGKLPQKVSRINRKAATMEAVNVPQQQDKPATAEQLFNCGICKAKCYSQSILNSHLNGKKHKAQLEKHNKDVHIHSVYTSKYVPYLSSFSSIPGNKKKCLVANSFLAPEVPNALLHHKALFNLKAGDRKENPLKVESDDDDECYEIDPIIFTRKLTFDDMNDVALVAEKGPVALRDFPHPRHLCGCLPFGTTSHESFCAKCFCCVCEVVAPCTQWRGINGHCHLSEKIR